MTISWTPVIVDDIAGSILVLVIAVYSAFLSLKWTRQKPENIFRHYIFLLTLAIVFFAISRSFGHLVKQILLYNHMQSTWQEISPYSGAINTASFIVIFAFGIYFHRFQKVHLEIEKYQNHLEALVAGRTAELEKTTATLRNVLDSSNPICITSLDFEQIQANKAHQAIWPKGKGDSGKLKCFEIRPGPLCGTKQCPLTQIKEGKEEVILEMHKQTADQTLEFIVTARPFRDASGNLLGIVESFQDITKRKKMERDLASERERLAVTLRSIGDGVISTDISGKIGLMNKVAEKLTGWEQSEALGRPIEEVLTIIDEKTKKPVENPVSKVLQTGQMVLLPSNTALIAKSGTICSIADSGAPIRDKNSELIGVVIVFRDVTEKNRMEEELLKTKKLQSVGVLAGGIAHDFNNILAAILGNISLALLDTNMQEKTREWLDQAEKASLRAKGLTHQLLTFSKGGEPIKETSSLQEVIKDSANFVLHGKMVACEFAFSENLWLVDIDKDQISQVVQNIIINATQAMPEGGKIRVSCENVDFAANQATAGGNRYVKIAIADQGPGIPADAIDRIFDPYFSTKTKGSGLGLAICHSIVTKHNGRIEVASEPGKGSVFSIYLPASNKSAMKPERDLEKKGRQTGQTAKILVMDDEEIIRKVAEEMLSRTGHRVVLAKDGAEAIRLYQKAREAKAPFDLTIMDLTIPGGMGGREAVRKILAINPMAKVIVSSGYSDDPVMASCQEYGFCEAIIKPYQMDDLLKTIGKVLALDSKASHS